MSGVYKYLQDATTNKDASGDYSSASTDFYIEADRDGFELQLHRMVVQVRDTGTFDADTYGNAITLTNGISALHLNADTTTKTDLTDGLPIITNADWGRVCYDVQIINFGIGDEFLEVRWTFSKSGSTLNLKKGERFALRLNDSFTGLNSQYFMVQGVYR